MEEKALVARERQVVNIEDFAMLPEKLLGQVSLIQNVMRSVMHDGEHFGVIPGTSGKPSLLKPGAEKLSVTFRLVPSYEVRRSDLPNGHREYEVVCTLTHAPTGQFFGQGVGSCTTMETRYRYRKAEQTCPNCGKPTIIKGKKEYGGGWLCYQKKGGCGAKFADGDPQIENQNMGRIEHDNPSDYYNTVLKMAKKRSHVDAVLTATAASDIFTQDVEDMAANGTISEPQQTGKTDPPPQQKKASPKKPQQQKKMVTCPDGGALPGKQVAEVYCQKQCDRFSTCPVHNKHPEVLISCPNADGKDVDAAMCGECGDRQGCPSHEAAA